MPKLDFVLTWDWEYDNWFVDRFAAACQKETVSILRVGPANLDEVLQKISNQELSFRVLLDRASDTDEAFDPLIDQILLSGTTNLNKMSHAVKAMDKATMHLEFLSGGIDVPYTIIISDKDDLPVLRTLGIEKLGSPFIVKPATGGGGLGVCTVSSLEDIAAAREEFDDEKYLVQERIVPCQLADQRAYYRVYYVCGQIIPCWWDNETRVFGPILSAADEAMFGLGKLREITKKIAGICNLDFFSTEICKMANNRFVVVDYVNDPCDMRPRSSCPDGVPEEIIDLVIKHIIDYIKTVPWRELSPLEKELLHRQREFELKLLRQHR